MSPRRRADDASRFAASGWTHPLPRAVPLGLLVLLAACGGGGGTSGATDSVSAGTPSAMETKADSSGTPVQVDTVAVRDLEATVQAPGETQALRETRVRVPFTGRLTSLSVTDGDRVSAGEALGTVVSRNSEAALEGARAMLADARTSGDSADAERALELARAGLVQGTLRAPAAGVVLSHSASAGDLVDLGETLVTIADRSSIVFVAQLAQADVPKVRKGQSARIQLTAAPQALTGTVHDILPAASSGTLSAPVRIDFARGRAPVATGLFGQVTVVVGVRKHVTVVPAAAVLRDDVYGTTRVAVVSGGRAIWVQVRTGLERGDTVQIVSPHLEAGSPVIVSGQVGLPDSTRVRIQP